jgi:hypothetical protein
MLNVCSYFQWTRVTSSKWTKAFCLLAALHCVLQIGLQFGAYANNCETVSSFETVVSNVTLTPQPFAILEDNGDLTLCANIPQRFGGPDPCTRLSFNGSSSNRIVISRRFTVSVENENGENSPADIVLDGLGDEPDEEVNVGSECIQTFAWVFDVLVKPAHAT